MKPCIECGEPSTSSRCPDHERKQRTERRGSARSRGYDTAWDRLSKRARAMSPFCEDAHLSPCRGGLTVDHKPEAWQRKAEGKAIRLQDVAVVCAGHNDARGSSRPGSERAQTHPGDPASTPSGPRGKPHTPLHNPSVEDGAA